MPTHVFRALNEAFLVFDGHLVINARLETSDAAILAVQLWKGMQASGCRLIPIADLQAGACTKYSRKYMTARRQAFASQEACGRLLAQELCHRVDPLLPPRAP